MTRLQKRKQPWQHSRFDRTNLRSHLKHLNDSQPHRKCEQYSARQRQQTACVAAVQLQRTPRSCNGSGCSFATQSALKRSFWDTIVAAWCARKTVIFTVDEMHLLTSMGIGCISFARITVPRRFSNRRHSANTVDVSSIQQRCQMDSAMKSASKNSMLCTPQPQWTRKPFASNAVRPQIHAFVYRSPKASMDSVLIAAIFIGHSSVHFFQVFGEVKSPQLFLLKSLLHFECIRTSASASYTLLMAMLIMKIASFAFGYCKPIRKERHENEDNRKWIRDKFWNCQKHTGTTKNNSAQNAIEIWFRLRAHCQFHYENCVQFYQFHVDIGSAHEFLRFFRQLKLYCEKMAIHPMFNVLSIASHCFSSHFVHRMNFVEIDPHTLPSDSTHFSYFSSSEGYTLRWW